MPSVRHGGATLYYEELAGNDEAHPWPISEELAKLLPHCEFIPEWKTGAALTSARVRVPEFLAKHTPGA